ncbi:ribulokinase [Sphingobacterium psychroaquaticum]|uniref:ribulokinase n=1 Tax=Sphingobacterium psychroaquaticum TaxID=561061 RepID=UPI00106C9346|nr:ribulokinase [Sphingobacterium psychroaquaticum]QBQ40796.1 ribulokinase [Sphingobacterium psychroaquaticum]
MNEYYVVGVDYGTDSVRSVLVSTKDGRELASSVFHYPRWKKGLYNNPSVNQFRQHPLDYLDGLQETIKSCLAAVVPEIAAQVVAISVDTTGSTPVAVNKAGTPLSLTADFAENPNAMFILWKDHTATREAKEINDHAATFDTDYLKYVGGVYSSEWFWSKILRTYRVDAAVREATYTWVEHCDWIPFVLTGGNDADAIKRSVCAAGHKGLWSEAFNGYPPSDFFESLDSLLTGQVERLGKDTYASNTAVGNLSQEWAANLGLSTNVVVGVGAFDCHMGAVGGQIEPYYLSKVMGTSTCDILVAPKPLDITVKGICGQVDGSVIPGMIGLEAGQSAFGDAYAWFKNILTWPLKNLFADDAQLLQDAEDKLLIKLSAQAAQVKPDITHPFSIDWLNGRRTPYANQNLKGAFFDVNISTDAVLLYRAVVESTCFGAKKIVECFVDQGIPVKGIIGLGGVARKSTFIMQMMADVLQMPIKIHSSEQTCALGAAMFAAVVAGVHPSVEDAMVAMGQGFDMIYEPNPETVKIYADRYAKYNKTAAHLEQNLYHV